MSSLGSDHWPYRCILPGSTRIERRSTSTELGHSGGCSGADVRPTITYWTNSQVNASVQIDPAASGLYDVQITSAGASGQGFLSTPRTQTRATSNRRKVAINPPGFTLSVT